jgi:UDPglucose--hexose-1-phosphate uridylyltransferase
MSEFRKDPLHNKWVLVVSERSKRPHAFSYEEALKEKGDEKNCPFCEGNESLTPPEVDSFRHKGKPDEPGWSIRVFPNKYPALDREIKRNLAADKISDIAEGYGFHEVIAETPSHTKDIYSMNRDEIILILKMYRKRYKILKGKKNIKSVFIFKNHGRAAGASLSHSHSQILALPIIPPFIEEEIKVIKETKSCIYCGLIEEALDDNRVLLENSAFIVLAPYASEYPYQLLVLSRNHQALFEEIEDAQIILLADVIKEVFRRYKNLLGNIPFNYFFNTPSIKKGHWNIQIMPKLIIPAGFEKGTGISINPIPPETAVSKLKGSPYM